ncbi:MAG: hypothetical protein IJ246_05385 [Clostridia bacterium]|nr:hypothetical protein [Clostridia bacterium]
MGIFGPVWKTKNERKEDKAVASLQKITDSGKLNRIVLSAPLPAVRRAAVRRLKVVTGGELPFDAKESLNILLRLEDRDYSRELDWYRGALYERLSGDDDFAKAVLKAKDPIVRSGAIYRMQDAKRLAILAERQELPLDLKTKAVEQIRDEDALEKLAVNDAFPASLRAAAVKRIKNQSLLSGIVWSKSDRDLRLAALMNLAGRDELERVRDESDDSELRQSACGRLGHDMKLVEYVPHGRDGKDALYQCEICGKEKLEPYEWSTADSV